MEHKILSNPAPKILKSDANIFDVASHEPAKLTGSSKVHANAEVSWPVFDNFRTSRLAAVIIITEPEMSSPTPRPR